MKFAIIVVTVLRLLLILAFFGFLIKYSVLSCLGCLLIILVHTVSEALDEWELHTGIQIGVAGSEGSLLWAVLVVFAVLLFCWD